MLDLRFRVSPDSANRLQGALLRDAELLVLAARLARYDRRHPVPPRTALPQPDIPMPMPHSSWNYDRCIGRGIVIGLALLAAACSDDDDPQSQVDTPTVALFSPSEGKIPIPNDLLFSGSVDLTLNPPITDPSNGSDPLIALSTVDGWSTVAPIVIECTRGLDEATVIGGDSVRVFRVTADPTVPVGGEVVIVDSELVAGDDYRVEVAMEYPDGSAIRILPLVPLAPSQLGANSVYMVAVTNAVLDVNGDAVQRDASYVFAATEDLSDTTPPDLLALQGLVLSQLDAYESFTTRPKDDVVVSFTFTTQSVGAVLGRISTIANGNTTDEQNLIDLLCAQLGTCGTDTAPDPNSPAQARLINVAPGIGTASELLGGGVGVAEIFNGIFVSPYYLTEGANTGAFDGLTNDTAPLTSPWQSRYAPQGGLTADRNLTRANDLPVATSSQQVPLLVSVPPLAGMPTNGHPVVIFQHGFGGNRAAMLFMAETLAAAGLACVAIDMPLHGINSGELLPNGLSIFSGYSQNGDLWERNFGLDLLSNTDLSPGPDGNADPSGAHFINLTNVAVSRDNIRQGIADLLNLKASLEDLMIMGIDRIDESQVHFIGHSLGGIVGTGFVGLSPDLVAATLAMPGSAVPYLLDGSPAFGPGIRAGLGANGVEAGTPAYSQFLAAAQTIVDAADPINYASLIVGADPRTPIYLTEIVGGGANMSSADLVIPNSVEGAPLAGTDPLVTALGLTDVSSTTTNAGGLQIAVSFIEGNHSSILFPTTPGQTPTAEETAAFTEIQNQLSGFHGTGGTQIIITNGTVIQ